MSCCGVGGDIGVGGRGLELNVSPAGGVSWLKCPVRSCSGEVFALSGGDGRSSMVGACTGAGTFTVAGSFTASWGSTCDCGWCIRECWSRC